MLTLKEQQKTFSWTYQVTHWLAKDIYHLSPECNCLKNNNRSDPKLLSITMI